MSYLRFEKAVMTNLQESLRRELLYSGPIVLVRIAVLHSWIAIRESIMVCWWFPYQS